MKPDSVINFSARTQMNWEALVEGISFCRPESVNTTPSVI
jgi:hypothetical protein